MSDNEVFENETHYENDTEMPEMEAFVDDYSDDEDNGASTAKTSAKSSNRALIRKVAAKAEELASAQAKDKALLAHLLGSGTTTADLTVAVITAGRSAFAAVSDLTEIAEVVSVKPMKAMLIATAAGRTRQKALWSLLVHFGKLTGKPNASESKAGMVIAEAVSELSKDQHSALDRALALAKR